MIIRKHKKDKPFAQIDRAQIQNPKLSLKAKGMYALLLSFPDDWVINVSDLINRNTDGRDSIKSTLKELEDNGYLKVINGRNENGQFVKNEYIFYEEPQTSEETPKEPQADPTTLFDFLAKQKYPLLTKEQNLLKSDKSLIGFLIKNLKTNKGKNLAKLTSLFINHTKILPKTADFEVFKDLLDKYPPNIIKNALKGLKFSSMEEMKDIILENCEKEKQKISQKYIKPSPKPTQKTTYGQFSKWDYLLDEEDDQ